jgi:hypothetical protein
LPPDDSRSPVPLDAEAPAYAPLGVEAEPAPAKLDPPPRPGAEAAPAASSNPSEAAPTATTAAREISHRAAEPQRAPEAAPSAANRPETPLAAERAADVLRQIQLRLSPELRQATIQLEPRELGRISIKVAIRGGAMRAELRAEKRSTLEALERHAPELCSAMEKAGLGAPELSLELGLGRRGSNDGAPDAPPAARGLDAPAATPAALQRALVHRVARDGVDTYA